MLDPLVHFEWKKSRMFLGSVRSLSTADVLVKLLRPGSGSRRLPSSFFAPKCCKRSNVCVWREGHAAEELEPADSKVAVDRVCPGHAADFRIGIVKEKGRPFEKGSQVFVVERLELLQSLCRHHAGFERVE